MCYILTCSYFFNICAQVLNDDDDWDPLDIEFPEPIVSMPMMPISDTMQNIMDMHGQELAYADDPDLMTIDKLLDKRVVKSKNKRRTKIEYLVRWAKDGEDDSWEPAKNITPDAIVAYEAANV